MGLNALGGGCGARVADVRVRRACVSRWRLSGLIVRPPLDSGNGAGDAIATYLNRQHGWQSLKALMAEKGERGSALQLPSQLQPQRACQGD